MARRLEIGGVEVHPGDILNLNLDVARLYDFTEVKIPVRVIRSKEDGPVMFISSTIHGDEINGIEIIRRIIRSKSIKRLKGTLIAVPIVNVFGFNNRSRYMPDRRDLNRCFPGSDKGSLGSKLASIFMKEIVEKCDYGIDLHTGAVHRRNLPQVRADLEDEQTRAMAEAFGAPVVLNSNLRDGSLREAVVEKSIPILVYEGGEALRFDERAIRVGVNGILSVMRSIGMLGKVKLAGEGKRETFTARSSHWVRAPQSGILRIVKSLGSRVEEGNVIGMISDPLGHTVVRVTAQRTGIVIGQMVLPLVNKGEGLFHVACFDDVQAISEHVEGFALEDTDVIL